MDSKWVYFVDDSKLYPKLKTKVWSVLSVQNQYLLGRIKWYGAWRQYCFYPTSLTIWNAECLSDVIEFIREHKKDRHTDE